MKEIVPLPAATVTLVRDAEGGLQVLMLQRNFRSGFMAGMHLFPGGAVDAEDAVDEVCARCTGLDDAAASGILGVERGGLAYWVAAIRESFEEAGVLLACDESGELVSLVEPERIARYRAYRHALNSGRTGLRELLARENLRLAADRLVYFSHWITPVGPPRRYDTRFFVARAPDAQEALHDDHETIGHAWMRPRQALDARAAGRLNMRTPTVKTLELFCGFDSVASLIAALSGRREIPAVLPRIAKDGRRLLPGEPGYDEVSTADGHTAWKT
jgi:8-oxo-dGTP pyrophosphatase MutT (NUDIX family)